ncbi:MAG: hypothetical protein ACP5IG_04535 [Candidatus Micrarchaeia archaeon]
MQIKKNPLNIIKYGVFFAKALKKYDVFHCYYKSFIPIISLDLPLLKKLDKKIIMQFCGCDARLCTKQFPNKTMHSACYYYNHNCGSDKDKERFIRLIQKYANYYYVAIPDILDFVPDADYIPYAVDREVLKPKTDPNNEIPLIIHAPTNPLIKGTKYVMEAIKELEKKRLKFKFVKLENVPFDKILDLYKSADIIVDQLLLGWYGTMAAENMALGNTVCSYIRPDLESYAKQCPIINCTPKTLAANLEELITDESLRRQTARKGPDYVARMHDAEKLTKKVARHYY